MMQLIKLIGKIIWGILYAIRWVIVAVLAIGVPFYIYVTFFADEAGCSTRLTDPAAWRGIQARLPPLTASVN